MQENINAFLRVLDATDNSTGGGTASSVAGAMAAGLAAMVARLSMDKKNLAPTQTYQSIAAEAEILSAELFNGGQEDAAAFDRVTRAYKMPKGYHSRQRRADPGHSRGHAARGRSTPFKRCTM